MISNSQSLAFGAKATKHTSRSRMWLKFIIAVVLTVGSWQVGSSVYLLAKAQLAQYLIADAWQATLKDGAQHKPWDWADTHPVAKLSFPNLDKTSYVLEGATGRNMAFGPARTLTGGMPGDQLSTIISAHNDSHFSFLKEVELEELIHVETTLGNFVYRVTDLKVVDSSKEQVLIKQKDELVLTTCYPFDALQTGGNLRYQITAIRL
ncbi:class GN sortase [Marinicella sp. S1101]|uniref:class GN sortase n=1 Tax=Marinicella marina TaxID=2996016 RepID=UPI0022609B61|nr:class GN sortase [Marinicella marina]MCX7552812.1 class GN sortase [Marinicella marina]MDJ1139879.1 class GN sortase [Marinicella marina]